MLELPEFLFRAISCTVAVKSLQILPVDSNTGVRYCTEILLLHVCLFREVVSLTSS